MIPDHKTLNNTIACNSKHYKGNLIDFSEKPTEQRKTPNTIHSIGDKPKNLQNNT